MAKGRNEDDNFPKQIVCPFAHVKWWVEKHTFPFGVISAYFQMENWLNYDLLKFISPRNFAHFDRIHV